MEIGRFRTAITLCTTALWVLITLCGWYGYWFAGLIAGVVLMLLQMAIGSASEGRLSKKLLVYPLGIWAVLWIVGFIMAKHYSDAFLNVAPSFKILGFHPSFAWILLAYWIGGVLTLTLGLVKFTDEWLPPEKWDAFKVKMEALNKEGLKNGK